MHRAAQVLYLCLGTDTTKHRPVIFGAATARIPVKGFL